MIGKLRLVTDDEPPAVTLASITSLWAGGAFGLESETEGVAIVIGVTDDPDEDASYWLTKDQARHLARILERVAGEE